MNNVLVRFGWVVHRMIIVLLYILLLYIYISLLQMTSNVENQEKNTKMRRFKYIYSLKLSYLPLERIRTINRRQYTSYVWSTRVCLVFLFVWRTTTVLFTNIRVDGLLIGVSPRRAPETIPRRLCKLSRKTLKFKNIFNIHVNYVTRRRLQLKLVVTYNTVYFRYLYSLGEKALSKS